MNYYKQIAEMLGVELGEEFSLKDSHTEQIGIPRYKITKEEGLMYSSRRGECTRSTLLSKIIIGNYSVVKLPWKPKINERYWRYQPHISETSWSIWCDDCIDLYRWKCGNCFRTEEEARTKCKEIMEQIQKEYEEA